MSELGHNSVAKEELKALIDRIESLEATKDGISSDIRDVYHEAKHKSYDVKAIRTIVRMRSEDAGKRADREAILETYLHALGMI